MYGHFVACYSEQDTLLCNRLRMSYILILRYVQIFYLLLIAFTQKIYGMCFKLHAEYGLYLTVKKRKLKFGSQLPTNAHKINSFKNEICGRMSGKKYMYYVHYAQTAYKMYTTLL
jgi:hypothetical protein